MAPAATPSSSRLRAQLAAMMNAAPVDEDPETEDFLGQTAGIEAEEGKPVDEYYVPSESKLRKALPLPLAGPKYAGKRVSRCALEEADGLDSARMDEDADEDDDDEDDDAMDAANSASDEEDGMDEEDGASADGSAGDDDEDGEEDEEADEEDEGEEDARLSLALGQADDPFLDELRRRRRAAKGAAEGEAAVQPSLAAQMQEEVVKGENVKRQLALGDKLLFLRIQLQRSLPLANRMPDYTTQPYFAADPAVRDQLQRAQTAVRRIISSLHQLQEAAVDQLQASCANEGLHVDEPEPEPEPEPEAEADDAAAAAASRTGAASLWRKLQATHRRFVPLRNASFDHWSARLQASSGGSVRKTFKALNQGIAVQLQQVMADRDRLFKRIHTNRSQYRVLGTKRTAEAAGLNEEIIDDSDFYQQLLADVIEAKAASADGDDNDPAVMARQWLAVRQYHQKVKNRVDTKASKGRKIRYDPHAKLVNFMVPIEAQQWPDTMREELFASLFGQRPPAAAAAEPVAL